MGAAGHAPRCSSASAAPERESHHSAGGLDGNAFQARGVTTPRYNASRGREESSIHARHLPEPLALSEVLESHGRLTCDMATDLQAAGAAAEPAQPLEQGPVQELGEAVLRRRRRTMIARAELQEEDDDSAGGLGCSGRDDPALECQSGERGE